MSKDYVRPMPKRWWMTRPGWRVFMLRELTAIGVAGYCILLIAMAAGAGSSEAWSSFYEFLESPLSLVIHVLVLALVLFHTITWFAAAPKALRKTKGDDLMPEHVIAGAHFAAWLVVSAVIAWLVLG